MNRDQAAAVLGLETADASDADINRAYQSRARVLHPDKHASSDGDRRAAEAAMTQVNIARDILRGGPAHARPRREQGRSQRRESSTGNATPPIWDDPNTACDLCAWGPAAPVRYRRVTGLIIWWRSHRLDATLCRLCGEAVYHDFQARTMSRGWWGFIAPLASLWALAATAYAVESIRGLPVPQARLPIQFRAPLPMPMVFVRPFWKRPAALIGPLLAAVIVVSVLVSSSSSNQRSSSSSIAPLGSSPLAASTALPATSGSGSALVGSCWAPAGGTEYENVPCEDSKATVRVTSVAASPQGCPFNGAGFFSPSAKGDGYACLTSM